MNLSSSAKADDPVATNLSIEFDACDYWMPAFAGMTDRSPARVTPAHDRYPCEMNLVLR